MTASRVSATTLMLALGLALAPGRSAWAQSEDGEGGADEAASTTPAAAEETGAEAKETEPQGADEEPGKRKLSDRIKSVERKAFLKKSRVEIFPQFGLSLNDPFFQHMIAGAAVGFHVADSLSFELRGGAVFASIKSSAIRFIRTETDSLLKNPPELKFHADLDVLWAPIYGKIALFSEGIIHFDTYITAGPGIFGTDAGLAPALNFGVGQRYFITDWLVARLEVRDYVFLDNRNDESNMRQNIVLGFALSGFFPTAFQYEYQ